MGIKKQIKHDSNVVKVLDGYSKFHDGYTESPFGHHSQATAIQEESEYFMQWIMPEKLHRLALRTSVGNRITYGRAKDVWNNRLGVLFPDKTKDSDKLNKILIPYLRTRRWFREMEKLSAYVYEQGESILLLYFENDNDIYNWQQEPRENAQILRVEAFNHLDYHIHEFLPNGDPKNYEVLVKGKDEGLSYETITINPSRIIRKTADNVEYRHTGYSELAVVADPIVILSTILKASGEAAYRWGTGHPVIFTKDLISTADFQKLQDKIGDFTRKTWHMIPSEYVDRIDLLGQAGSMLNLKSLADIAIDQIIIGSGFPRPVLLGEVAGVVSGSEVNERTYFALLDADHTELEEIIRIYFDRDPYIRKLFKRFGIDNILRQYWELDWGIREVLNKSDEEEFKQKKTSRALALSQICTVDECREILGLVPLGADDYGDVVLGLSEFYMMEYQMAMQQMMTTEMNNEPQNTTNVKQGSSTTSKQASSISGDLEKNKRLTPKTDSWKEKIDEMITIEDFNNLTRNSEAE